MNVSNLIFGKPKATPKLPVVEGKPQSSDAAPAPGYAASGKGKSASKPREQGVDEDAITPLPPPAPPPTVDASDAGPPSAVEAERKPNVAIRFYRTVREILLSSYFNLLLLTVPAAIAVGARGVNPIIVFALNAVAIVPLASLLSHATEVVASRLGDTVGALLNVTFGNAVELIILWVSKLRGGNDRPTDEIQHVCLLASVTEDARDPPVMRHCFLALLLMRCATQKVANVFLFRANAALHLQRQAYHILNMDGS